MGYARLRLTLRALTKVLAHRRRRDGQVPSARNLALYDALVRLAQPFTLRYPLVEGQGNFGNIDGDNAAAERYTEARLTRTAMQLMEGLDEGTVDFVPTYNNEEKNRPYSPACSQTFLPTVPAASPSAWRPRSPAITWPSDRRRARADRQSACHSRAADGTVSGAGFCDRGLVVDSAASISAAYETGRGSFRVRGRFFAAEAEKAEDREAGIERLGGGQYQLVISEIPYMVQKGRLIEQIAQAIADRKLPILEDVRDESDEQVRLVLVPKSRNIDPELLRKASTS